MALLDRYLLKEWVKGFALTIGVILGILVLQHMYDSLPDLLETDAKMEEILLFFAFSLPTYLPTVVPIAFLVSLLFSLGGMHRNNEILVMRSTGRSLFRISRPLFGVGVLLSLGMLSLSSTLIPWSVEQSRTFLENLEYDALERERESREVGVLHNLGFDNRSEGRLWFMNRFSERAWLGLGVSVHKRNEEGEEVRRLAAREAYFDDTRGHWVFVEGREMVFDPETGDPLRVVPFEEKAFPEFEEDPNLMLALRKRPKELSLLELRELINAIPPEDNASVHAYLVRYHWLWSTPFTCLVVVGLAVPFSVSGVRTNPMVGVSKCMGIFGVFYVLVSVGTILGERAVVPAWLGAWFPNLFMLLVGIFLFYRHR